MNTRETEIKLPLESVDAAKALLQRLPASLLKPRHFEDNFMLDAADQRLRTSGQLLRIRVVDSAATLTYKGDGRISDGVKDREEIEVEIQAPEALEKIFARLGYRPTFRYQKYRTIYEAAGYAVHICIDETPIGIYLELEGDIADIHRCAEQLGFRREQYITESYAALYFKWCRENNRQPGHMTFA